MAGLAVALDGSWEVGNRPLRFEPDDMVSVVDSEAQGWTRLSWRREAMAMARGGLRV